MITLLNSNSLYIPLADQSVNCVVTSPPYWGLRDYGTSKWIGGNPECNHKVSNQVPSKKNLKAITSAIRPGADAFICKLCGAARVDDQIGLEPTPQEYVNHLVLVFREVWRVLRNDGSLWINLGDSYMSQPSWGRGDQSSTLAGRKHSEIPHARKDQLGRHERGHQPGLKPKDLVGIPWRVAFALQADGWYLRSDIIWSKPNPMPESVSDRPTKSHEYIFLLTKRKNYYYDAEAIKQPLAITTLPRMMRGVSSDHKNINGAPGQPPHSLSKPREYGDGYSAFDPNGANARSVWNIATESYPGAHFATYPTEIPRRAIKAGTSERGICPVCGAPWRRTIKKEFIPQSDVSADRVAYRRNEAPETASSGWAGMPRGTNKSITTGWRPTCKHETDPIPALILDPFCGSGTTLQVARELGRSVIGLDLSLIYLQNEARDRLGMIAMDQWINGIKNEKEDYDELPLFSKSE